MADVCSAFLRDFFDELRSSGVEHVCVSPGSRSTPLTLAAVQTPGLCCTPHLDERSAGFFALGLARRTRRPVALICTSGTAAANYLPAVVEAWYARVPLIVLTADRPAELRDWGAGQTIDQLKLYGSHVKRFVEVEIKAVEAELKAELKAECASQLRYARTLACRSVADVLAVPAGPVHLNWPLREPFDLGFQEREADVAGAACVHNGEATASGGEPGVESGVDRERRAEAPFVSRHEGVRQATTEQLEWLQTCCHAHPEAVIACGWQEPDEALSLAVAALGRAAGWPILADPLSQLRCGPHTVDAPIIACGDLLLRDRAFADAHRPQLVIRIGGSPVSKAQRQWLEAHPPRHLIAIDAAGEWNQPDHLLTAVFHLDPTALCLALAASFDQPRHSGWLQSFTGADAAVSGAMAAAISSEDALYEPRAARELAELLPAGALLYVSNSMPVRDVDAFLPTRAAALDVLCNRGANGIDGVVSSALGAAAARRGPVVLLIGDLALLHDIGGLLAARQLDLDLTIIVLNNDGGAIFSFLPIAEEGDRAAFDDFFSLPHGLDFGPAATLYGLNHVRVTCWREYREAIGQSVREGGVQLIEVPVQRDANMRHLRDLQLRVKAVLAGRSPR